MSYQKKVPTKLFKVICTKPEICKVRYWNTLDDMLINVLTRKKQGYKVEILELRECDQQYSAVNVDAFDRLVENLREIIKPVL